jgi:hypothetical protein
MPLDPADDRAHPGVAVEEWVFTAWTADGRLGLVSGHRLLGRRAWYWAAFAVPDGRVFHVLDGDVPVRADPFVVKGAGLWAEHQCDAPMEQWSIGNETYAAALDDRAEALGRAYGEPTAIGFDLEWYATGDAVPCPHGYEQAGVVHGVVELAGVPRTELVEVPAHRWHRWRHDDPWLDPVDLPAAGAHGGAWAAFGFPDGAVVDWVVTPSGWRRRAVRPPSS